MNNNCYEYILISAVNHPTWRNFGSLSVRCCQCFRQDFVNFSAHDTEPHASEHTGSTTEDVQQGSSKLTLQLLGQCHTHLPGG